jgi:PAS domain S-box-containing protein
VSGGGGQPLEGGARLSAAVCLSHPGGPAALMDAAALGVSALAEVLIRTEDGICVVDAERRYVYANPAACRMQGHPVEQLRGRDFLGSFPAREHMTILRCLPERLGDAAAPFTCTLRGSDGVGHEIVCSTFAIDMAGRLHCVAIFRDLAGPQAAVRTAVALAQTAAQLAGTGTTEEILVGLARHGVEGTRALAVGIVVVGDDHKLAVSGGYGFPATSRSREAWTAGSVTLDDLPGGDVLLANKPVVLPDARSAWEASPVMEAFAATLKGLDWQGAVYVPLSWEDQVFGVFGVYLPSGMAGPSEAELAFYTALADQAAVVVTNARLAASLERTRLARELHDSVSQALFSMTMHARAAQLSMAKAGLDESGPLGRSIAQLAELTRGALAEMRALIFELRPGALAEEGLVAALRKQGAALTAREQVAITVEGPEQRLELGAGVEEHLYRIVSEALHNVVKHAGADGAAVIVTARAGILRVAVSDDGVGFDPAVRHAGHLGLSTMAERAEVIGAELTITSVPGTGTTVAVSLPHDRRDHGKADPGAR